MSSDICAANANLQPENMANLNLLAKAHNWYENGMECALATVIETWGSSPRPIGSQLVINEKGEFEGSVSGGCIETSVVTEALDVIESGRSELLEFGVSDAMAWEVGLACGGKVQVFVQKLSFEEDSPFLEILSAIKNAKTLVSFTNIKTGIVSCWLPDSEQPCPYDELYESIEKVIRRDKGHFTQTNTGEDIFINPHNPPMRLFVIGAVHISQALVPIAQQLGYDVTIIDHRTAWANPERFPNVALDRRWADEALAGVDLNHRCAIVTLTHDPKLDDPALTTALKSNAFYIGA
ncbi:MAG: XdhC family protein, partial [Alphaproteobacteria bacterium]|nr:XdhC family protein [Alphaproteobacteria bacterium]